ncbi:MAG TPA: hypothetical protein VHG51_18200 [Longimicrobiaceae bacterium]|nr:hypothetical protein [Longimicrobiaceae bacterium]
MALVKVLAGAAILAVGLRELQGTRVHRLAWQLTGFTFVVGGTSMVLQTGIFAPWAYFAGRGTPVYDAFLRWNPALTQSRTFLVIGLGVVLSLLPLIGRYERGVVRLAVAFLLAAMAAGGVFGWLEGAYVSTRFYPSTAVANLLELIALFAALFVALTADTMDRHLWLALAVYSVSIGLNVIVYSALAWIRVEGVWSPSPRFVQFFLVAAHATMLGLALRRLQLARRGVRVGSLLEPPLREPISVLR